MNNPKKKVLVGLSGGVDSAVAAYLLLQEGYEVIAGFMKNYANEDNPHCHTREDRNTAIKVAQHLGIKTFCIFDFRKEYEETIIDYIFQGYKQGYTPNPDVLCNTKIKFKLFLDAALGLGCDYVATGHYARITHNETGYHLLKGVDTNKDQSYFLAGLDQHQLAHALFPLGALEKPRVRAIAQEIGLPNAERKDSQGLCFIGKVPMKEFLKQSLPIQHGAIVDTNGTTLGTHEGARFYTIGQRQGLGLAGGPWFVIKKDVETNTILVGREDEQQLFAHQLTATDIHRVSATPPTFPLSCCAKIRYRQADQQVRVEQTPNGGIIVTFTQKQRAISSGQTIALYQGEILIGNGIIQEALHT